MQWYKTGLNKNEAPVVLSNCRLQKSCCHYPSKTSFEKRVVNSVYGFFPFLSLELPNFCVRRIPGAFFNTCERHRSHLVSGFTTFYKIVNTFIIFKSEKDSVVFKKLGVSRSEVFLPRQNFFLA